MAGQRDVAAAVEPLGQPEVGDARLVGKVDENVRRFEVAVNDVGGVGGADGPG